MHSYWHFNAVQVYRTFQHTKGKKKSFLLVSQSLSRSTSAFRPPTDGKGADITRAPATPTGPRGTHTTSTTRTASTPTANTTTTRRSTTRMKRASQGIRSTPTPQVGTFLSSKDGIGSKRKMQTSLDLARMLQYELSAGGAKWPQGLFALLTGEFSSTLEWIRAPYGLQYARHS